MLRYFEVRLSMRLEASPTLSGLLSDLRRPSTAFAGEIDYGVEANNARRFASLYGSLPNVSAPAVYPELSTRTVLTLEWVDGVRLTDEEDSSLAAARMATWGILERAVADARTDASDDEEAHDSAYAAFAIVHGLAGIWLSGATPPPPDPDSRARAIVRHLAFETL